MPVSPPYLVHSSPRERLVQAWAQRPIPFEIARDHHWLRNLVAELRGSLHGLAVQPGECLAGYYDTTDMLACDVENRLFTNPARAIPRVTHLTFERGPGAPPEPPSVLHDADARHYYEYAVGGQWQQWHPGVVLARWSRVPQAVASDGTARPWWVSMRRAARAGHVAADVSQLDAQAPFGIRLVVHATRLGPRSANTVSEQAVDGAIAAFHPVTEPEAVARALASRLPGVDPDELLSLARLERPTPLFPGPAIFVSPSGGPIISPDDTRCWAGASEVRTDARGRVPEMSGELFSLVRATDQPVTQHPG